MFKFIRQAIGGAALLGVALLPLAHAGTITFEDVAATAFGVGDSVLSGGFRFTMGGNFGQIDGAGGFSNAPNGSSGQFLGAMNSPFVMMTNDSGRLFGLQGIDFGFIQDGETEYSEGDQPGGFFIFGFDKNDDQVAGVGYAYNGADVLGQFSFLHAGALDLGTDFTTGMFKTLIFVGCTFTANGCEYQYENLSQFAIDNIDVSIPEPGTVVLMAVGLLGLGLRHRRVVR